MSTESKSRKRALNHKVNGFVTPVNGKEKVCPLCVNGDEFIRSHRIHRQKDDTFTRSSGEMEGDHDELSRVITENGSPPGSWYHYYSQFGWYWNYFPKTDYTYLASSPYYKKEIAPGIPVIPNLSREPLKKKSGSGSFLQTSLSDSTASTGSWFGEKLVERVTSVVVTSWRSVTTTVMTSTTLVTTPFSSRWSSSAQQPSNSLVNKLLLLIPFLLLPLFLLYLFGGEEEERRGDGGVARVSSHGWSGGFLPYMQLPWLALVNFTSYLASLPYYLYGLFAGINSLPASAPLPNCNTNYDLSFILNSLDTMKKKIETLEQQCAVQNENKEIADVLIRNKVNILEHNLAELKTNVHEAEKSIAESKRSHGLDLSLLKGQVDMGVMNSVVNAAIAKYHADQTSEPDFALQSSGGQVVSIKCTQPHSQGGQYMLWGIPFMSKTTSPDVVLQPGSMPGECWAFEGEQGYIVIKLSSRIKVTSFTVDHAPKEILPRGQMASAPKDFRVLGLKDLYDKEPVDLGSFTFSSSGESIQRFKAKESNESFDLIELDILSNHGNMQYTCLYRFRVHGTPITEDEALYIGGPL